MTDNKFDLRQFNKEFVKKKEQTKSSNQIKSQKKLDYLTEQANVDDKPLYDQSIWEILVGVKNTWFNILDDVLARRFGRELFTTGNRLFYIGLTVIIIAVLIYLYNFFSEDDGAVAVAVATTTPATYQFVADDKPKIFSSDKI